MWVRACEAEGLEPWRWWDLLCRPHGLGAAGDRPLGQGGRDGGRMKGVAGWMKGVAGWLAGRDGTGRGQRDEEEGQGPPPPNPPPPGPSVASCCHLVGSQSLASPRWGPPLPPHPRVSPTPLPVTPRWQACLSAPSLSAPRQHYTTDADGLCTRLIKPKVMEGTVAAQDEFSRSEWLCPFPGSWGPPHQHPLTLLSPPRRRLGPQHEGPQVAADHWQRGIRR